MHTISESQGLLLKLENTVNHLTDLLGQFNIDRAASLASPTVVSSCDTSHQTDAPITESMSTLTASDICQASDGTQEIEQMDCSDFNLSDIDFAWLFGEIRKPEYGLAELSANSPPSTSALPEPEIIENLDCDSDSDCVFIEMKQSKVTRSRSRQPKSKPTPTPPLKVPLRIIIKRLNCPVAGCKKVEKTKKLLNAHLLRRHDIHPFRCRVRQCNGSFKNPIHLGQHIKAAHLKSQGKNSKWPCGECSKHFMSYHHLYSHSFSVHEKGTFQCSFERCTFVAKNRCKVTVHLKKHKLQKPKVSNFPCPVAGCSRAFNRARTLQRHQETHSQKKKKVAYRCKWPQCGTLVSSRSTLHDHIRMHHFRLPRSISKQRQMKIVDDRKAGDYIEKIDM